MDAGRNVSGGKEELPAAHKNAGKLLMSLFPQRSGSSPSPSPDPPTPPRERALSPPHALEVAVPVSFVRVENRFAGAEVLGCDADSLRLYEGMPEFGIAFESLTDGHRVSSQPTALAFFQVVQKQLHGLWEAQPGVHIHRDDGKEV